MEPDIIAKEDLEDGALYRGISRNCSAAYWDARKQRFIYQRIKGGRIVYDALKHIFDEPQYDAFTPFELLERRH